MKNKIEKNPVETNLFYRYRLHNNPWQPECMFKLENRSIIPFAVIMAITHIPLYLRH